jgi:hypothetical protein
MLVIDRSGSMLGEGKIAAAETAAISFVGNLSMQDTPPDRAGLVSFNETNSLDQVLTTNASALIAKINALSASGNTAIADAVGLARSNMPASSSQRVIVLLTDGNPNVPEQNPVQAALDAAIAATNDGIRVITIGLGLDVSESLLLEMASANDAQPSGKDYYRSPTEAELARVFNRVFRSLCVESNQPPTLNSVNLLQLPAENGAYVVPVEALLTNSDAFDADDDPLVFKVDSVVCGSLLINGAPFSAGNCTINSVSSAVWIAPSTMPLNMPALRVYVHDGFDRSTNTVDVRIKQHPKSRLLGWGSNFNGTVGDGTLDACYVFAPPWCDWQLTQLEIQDRLGILPFDPRWRMNYSVPAWPDARGQPPAPVLDIDDPVTSVSVFGDVAQCRVAVTKNK